MTGKTTSISPYKEGKKSIGPTKEGQQSVDHISEGEQSVDRISAINKDEPLNFMHMVPHRIREHIQKEWQVGFPEPRFKSPFWNRFFVFLGASEHLTVRLDRMGSEIWGHIDGERNVRRILSLLELKHPDKENLRDRLVHYLKRLEYHGYIELREAGDGVIREE